MPLRFVEEYARQVPNLRLSVAAADAAGLTARATERLLRVARTIADLDNAERVAVHHLEEAARYRVPTIPSLSTRGG